MSTTAVAPTPETYVARLKERYENEIRGRLQEELELSSVMEVPRVTKVTLNMGVGEAKTEADQTIESNGVRLFVDPISVRYLKGAEVDFVDSLAGGGFTIRNPNAKSTCGCGSSFSA